MGEAKRRRAYLAGADEGQRAAAAREQAETAHAWWWARGQEKDPVARVVSQPPAYRNQRYLHPETADHLATSYRSPTAPRPTQSSTTVPWDNPHTCEVRVWWTGDTQSVTHTGSIGCEECRRNGPPSVHLSPRTVMFSSR